ncbi:MAG: thioredoxin-dependent thiol peroxidase [Proteobacteria bacterium]|nr:thioredoxin-dependent thiol peroxidase [Pseudomonadota bacterium]
MKLEIGKAAPLFSLASDEGEISLLDLKGKNVVLYFYPKDDTPGCTIEAQDFSKKIKEFEKLDCVVLGISKDSVKSHCNFIEKYNLSFNLLSDNDGEVCAKYDVIKEKSMFGKKYFGIDRSTFLIDKMGKIIKIWNSVKVNGHVEDVLQTLAKAEK